MSSDRNKKDFEKHFHWRHSKDYKCVTIAYDTNTNKFLGINTFGIRMRHVIVDLWLTEERDIFYVLAHLADANFDPEFYKTHEADIVAQFNVENNTNIVLKRTSWKRIFTKA